MSNIWAPGMWGRGYWPGGAPAGWSGQGAGVLARPRPKRRPRIYEARPGLLVVSGAATVRFVPAPEEPEALAAALALPRATVWLRDDAGEILCALPPEYIKAVLAPDEEDLLALIALLELG